MNMRTLEQDWDTNVYDGGQFDRTGLADGQVLAPSGRRFGLHEESTSADSHFGFVVDSIALEEDPE